MESPTLPATAMPRRSGGPRAIALGAWIVTVGIGLATLWTGLATDAIELITRANGGTPNAADGLVVRAVLVAFVAISTGYASVGSLLVGRPGAARIGLLLLAGGTSFAFVFFGYLVGGKLAIDDPGSTLAGAVLVLGPAAVGPGYSLILPALAIAFPDGRLPSRRWHGPVRLVAALVAFGSVIQLIRPGPLVGGPELGSQNPFGLDALPRDLVSAGDVATSAGILLISGLGLVAVVVRYRRGDSTQRQQMRWFLAAVAIAAVPLALSSMPVVGGPSMALLATGGLLLVPIAVGIAVTRYRLYEIDHLINRTLVYVPLTALLAGLYAATVTLLQRAFQSVTGDRSDAAVIISTLILASVFTPIRKWLEGFVDRHFKPAPTFGSTAAATAATAVDPTAGPAGLQPDVTVWEARVTAIAVEAVRAELRARGFAEPRREVSPGVDASPAGFERSEASGLADA